MKPVKRRRPKLKISPMIFRMGKLTLEPGDLVILQTDLDLDHDQVTALQKQANEQFKPFKAILVTHGLKIGVLRKAKR